MIRLLLVALVVAGVPLPRGARATADRYVSPKSYRDTVDFIDHWLTRQGTLHHEVGPYRARGIDVTRFVSDQPATPWLAIHVYRQAAKTWIFVVPRPP